MPAIDGQFIHTLRARPGDPVAPVEHNGALTSRMAWGVPHGWAVIYPQWPEALRKWLREARAAGLLQIVVTPAPHGFKLDALPPGERWEDWA